MLAGVLDAAPPPKIPDPPVLPAAPPNRPPLLGALDVLLLLLLLLLLLAVPKRDGVAPPVEGAAPKRGLLGVLLPPPLFCWPNEKLILVIGDGQLCWAGGGG